MLVLTHDGSQFVIEGSYQDRDLAVTINGVRAAGAQRWTIPTSVPTYLEAEYVIKGDGGVIDQSAQEWWDRAQRGMTQLLDLKASKPQLAACLGGFELRDYQEADARFLSALGSGLIFNDMRTGKSLTMLRTLDLLDAFPALIAVPPSTVFEMERQVRLAFPDKSLTVLSSGMTAPQRKKALLEPSDIVVLGHNQVELHAKLSGYGGLHKKGADGKSKADKEKEAGKYELKELDARQWKAVVVDEAHRVQNPQAAITRAIWNLADKAPHKFALTGTPAANSEAELWALIRLCWPSLFPAKSKWLSRYVNMVPNRFGISEARGYNPATKEMWDQVFSLMHVRRQREGGPEQLFRVIPVELSKTQAKIYNQLATHSMAEVEDELVTATDTMTLGHRLIQATGGVPVVVNDQVKSLKGPSGKVDALIDLLEGSPEKTIVVCEHRLLVDFVRDALLSKKIETVALVGGMKDAQRTAAKKSFQEGTAQVVVINEAGTEGAELSAATRTVFLERSYKLEFNMQAEARNMSAAQTSSTVEVIDIVAKGTLDEAIRAVYLSKDEALHRRLGDQLKDRKWIREHLYG